MAHEHLHSSGEHKTTEVGHEAARRSKELTEDTTEISPTENKERVAEAHREALEAAKETEQLETQKENHITDEFEPPASSKKREQSFRQTMAHIQKEMPKGQQVFSKIIHRPIIEKTSDVVGSTIARPDSIITGSLCAFLAVLALYLVARHNGFSLSGFETIGAFILGWIIGVLFDLARAIFKK